MLELEAQYLVPSNVCRAESHLTLLTEKYKQLLDVQKAVLKDHQSLLKGLDISYYPANILAAMNPTDFARPRSCHTCGGLPATGFKDPPKSAEIPFSRDLLYNILSSPRMDCTSKVQTNQENVKKASFSAVSPVKPGDNSRESPRVCSLILPTAATLVPPPLKNQSNAGSQFFKFVKG